MKYLGHRVLYGNANYGKPGVIVYAQPDPNKAWTQVDPARLKNAPMNFNAAAADCAPAFRRDFVMMNPSQLRVDAVNTDDGPILTLHAYPQDDKDPLVWMRMMNNYALNFAQMFGFKGWAVILKHPVHDPFLGSIPQSDELPAPTDRKAAIEVIKGEDAAGKILNMRP